MKTIQLSIFGMNCASCVNHIQKDVEALKGVHHVAVNLASNKAEVMFDDEVLTIGTIIKQIQKTGYDATLIPEDVDSSSSDHHHHGGMEDHAAHASAESDKEVKAKLKKALFGLLVSVIIIACDIFLTLPFEGVIPFILTLILLLYTGREFFTKGIPPFVLRARPNMDTLVAIGVGAAFLYSSYNVFFSGMGEETHRYFMDAAVVSTFLIFGRYLEAKSKGQAGAAVQKLLHMGAKVAHKKQGNQILDIPIHQVEVGDELLVKPGEKIPVDGVLIDGQATIDESMVTGESIPSDKEVQSKVIGATINGTVAFTMRAEKVGKDMLLSQMVKMVEQAQMSRAPIQKLVDIISTYFVWIVAGIAVLTFVYWYFISGNIATAFMPAVAVLIIACPCALGLATPISIIVGTGKGAEMGILIKKAESLEKMHKITAICFDKTGTITEGKPVVTDTFFLNATNEDEYMLLQYAASLEAQSEHPLANAVVKYTQSKEIQILKAQHATAVTGKGMEGSIEGSEIAIGTQSYMEGKRISLPKEVLIEHHKLLEQGKTVLLFSVNDVVHGLIALQDKEKESAKKAVQVLHAKGIKTVMITGDNKYVAQMIAKNVGIDEVFAEVSPEDKVRKIQELQKRGEYVAMVGDGINDAPALATAEVGIAMGTGTDIAMEAGDIVLVKGDLLKAILAIELSQATLRNIKQNLFWAFLYNIVGIPFAALGLLNPIVSGIAMAFSSISVVLNALRLRGFHSSYQKINE